MKIITIPSMRLIRRLPLPKVLQLHPEHWTGGGMGAAKSYFCSALVRVDSSHFRMAYEVECEPVGKLTRIATVLLDDELVEDPHTNTVLELETAYGGLHASGFSFLDWAEAVYSDGQHGWRALIADLRTPYCQPITGLRGKLSPFYGRGTLYCLDNSQIGRLFLVAPSHHAYPAATFPHIPAIAFASDGKRWIGFSPKKIGVAAVSLFLHPEHEVHGVPIDGPEIFRTGQPVRYNDGWAFGIDDGSGECKIALVTDEEINST